MKNKFILSTILVFTLFLTVTSKVVLSKSGCCSWHGGVCGCDSSVGRQTCCDGTYSPSCTCAYNPPPVYIPPPPPTATPTPIALNIQSTAVFNNGTCTYDINASWDRPTIYDRFSVSAVKTDSTQCLNPGPNVDTTNTSGVFSTAGSGRYLINIKPGNSNNWDYYLSYCQEIIIPKIKPSVDLKVRTENGKTFIDYKTICATSLQADNGIGYIKEIGEGSIEVNSDENKIFQFTANSKDSESETKSITVASNKPTFPAVVEPSEIPEENNTNNLGSNITPAGVLLAGALIGGGYIYLKNKKT